VDECKPLSAAWNEAQKSSEGRAAMQTKMEALRPSVEWDDDIREEVGRWFAAYLAGTLNNAAFMLTHILHPIYYIFLKATWFQTLHPNTRKVISRFQCFFWLFGFLSIHHNQLGSGLIVNFCGGHYESEHAGFVNPRMMPRMVMMMTAFPVLPGAEGTAAQRWDVYSQNPIPVWLKIDAWMAGFIKLEAFTKSDFQCYSRMRTSQFMIAGLG
jgi:hypothetical protein